MGPGRSSSRGYWAAEDRRRWPMQRWGPMRSIVSNQLGGRQLDGAKSVRSGALPSSFWTPWANARSKFASGQAASGRGAGRAQGTREWGRRTYDRTRLRLRSWVPWGQEGVTKALEGHPLTELDISMGAVWAKAADRRTDPRTCC